MQRHISLKIAGAQVNHQITPRLIEDPVPRLLLPDSLAVPAPVQQGGQLQL